MDARVRCWLASRCRRGYEGAERSGVMPIVEASGSASTFPAAARLFGGGSGAVRAVDGISFAIERGPDPRRRWRIRLRQNHHGQTGAGAGAADRRAASASRDRICARSTPPVADTTAAPSRRSSKILTPRSIRACAWARSSPSRSSPTNGYPRARSARACSSCWTWSDCRAARPTSFRTSSPAASASASPSPARWRCRPSSSCWTSRSRRWTCRSARRS